MKTNYLNLAIGAPKRLAILKRDFEQFKAKRNNLSVTSWRNVRYSTFRNSCELSQGLNNGEPIWNVHSKEPIFRNERDCGDVIRLDYNGWYTDVHQDETAIGIIASLPHGRFLAGYRWTSNDERVYFSEIYTDENDAAHAANGHAESFAEISREASEKWEEARTLENDIDDALHRLKECIVLRHSKCMSYVRDEINELIESIRDKRNELSTEYKDYI